MNPEQNEHIIKLYCQLTGRKLLPGQTPSRRNLYRFQKWVEMNRVSIRREMALNDIISQ